MTKKDITQLSYEITGFAIKIHKELGPGLLESVYEKCLYYELSRNGYVVIQQISVPVIYGDIIIDTELKLDLLINNTIIVELKAVEDIHPIYEAQLLTYMKLLDGSFTRKFLGWSFNANYLRIETAAMQLYPLFFCLNGL